MVKLHRIHFIILMLFSVGCTTYSPYRYNFSLIDPYVEEGLKYEDEDVSIQFAPTAEYIWVSIYNKSEGDIYFVRDKAEYVDPWGESHRILYGWKYGSAMKDFMRNGNYLNPIRIAPKSTNEGNIWINVWPGPDLGEGWSTVTDVEIEYLNHSMFPEYPFQGNGAELKDSTFFLILPVSFDGYKRNYNFTFMITDVEIVDSKKT